MVRGGVEYMQNVCSQHHLISMMSLDGVEGQREPTATRVHNKGWMVNRQEQYFWFEFKFIPKLTNVVNSQVDVFPYLLTKS